MELLVDIGNTHIRWSDPGRLRLEEADTAKCADLPSVLAQDWASLQHPTSLWVSSVAKADLNASLEAWVRDNWGLKVCWVKSAPQGFGVINGYNNPLLLGVDRWLALIAAHDLFHKALVVVDCGTATTVDALDAGGRHLGGLILPGLRMMYDSLLGKTAIAPPGPVSELGCFAKDTASAIESAALLATAGLVQKMLSCTHQQLQQKAECVVTGGGAEVLSRVLEPTVRREPHLVLKGLALIAKHET